MRVSLSFFALMPLIGPFAAAQPAVNAGGVVNAASYIPAPLPNGGIARGSLFVVFGSNLGPPALLQAPGGPLQTELGRTSIQVKVGTVTTAAILFYTSASQVAALLPSATPQGDGTLTVTYNGQTSAAAPIRVVQSAFGTFARNQAGSGPAVVQDFVSPAETPLNSLAAPGQPGQVAILWGTGLGPVNFDETVPPVVQNVGSGVEVLVAGRNAQVLYAGRSAQFPGIDQVNFRIPPDAPSGCYVPVAVRVAGVVSNFTTMSIGPAGSACSDPAGLNPADIARTQSTGSLRLGSIVLTRIGTQFGPLNLVSDSGSAGFSSYTVNQLLASRGVTGVPVPGSCLVSTFLGTEAATDDPVAPAVLDAGPAINISGPNGSRQLLRTAPGQYSAELGGGVPGAPGAAVPPGYLDPGTYAVDNGSGGADVGAFQATLAVPAPLNWTNRDSAGTIPRSQDLSITWSGGDPTEYVVVSGASLLANPQAGAAFVCTERVSAGRLTVPSAVLSALPASSSQAGVPAGFLQVGAAPLLGTAARFPAPGLDAAYLLHTDFTLKNVSFQ